MKSFQQVLTSSLKNLALQPAQEIRVPVHIKNPGPEVWASAGKAPVTISYKWFKGTEMLPIEGERTVLPSVVQPNHSTDADVRIIAPGQAGDFTVRITLVQEGVAWFMMKSNTYLELPASVK